jgi:hypothetical protein
MTATSFDGPDRLVPDLRVGEIRALRTFQLSSDGSLRPVAYTDVAWVDGPNAANCDLCDHTPAAPGCGCGFWAYGTRGGASQHRAAKHLLAVVACWGRVVPGTLGLRAQYARIEAIWVSGRIPSGRIALLRKRYPSAVVYGSKRAMLRRHRLSRLDSYRRLPYLETRLAGLRFSFWRQDGPLSTRKGSILTTIILLLCWGLLLVMIPVVAVWSL